MDRLVRIALWIVLRKLVRKGNLRITTASGSTLAFGDGIGALVAIRFVTHTAEWGVLIDPELKLGEAYVDGGIILKKGSIADLLCWHAPHARRRSGSIHRDALLGL